MANKQKPKSKKPAQAGNSGVTYSKSELTPFQKGLTVLPLKKAYEPLPETKGNISGVFVDPLAAAKEEIGIVSDNSPVMTLAKSACSDTSTFAGNLMRVYSILFNIPAFYQRTSTEIVQDKRGTMVELESTGAVFKNISKNTVTIHANTPIGMAGSKDVLARVPGFKKGKRYTDAVTLEPGASATFTVNWKNKPAGYSPIHAGSTVENWPNVVGCTFSIHCHNDMIVPSSTDGAATMVNPLSECVSVVGTAKYTIRQYQSVPNAPIGTVVKLEEVPHFTLVKLEDGPISLWGLDPITQKTAMFLADPIGFIEGKTVENGAFINDLKIEGSHYGMLEEKLSSYNYDVVSLAVRTGNGPVRAASLQSRQSILSRIALPTHMMTDPGTHRDGGSGPGQNTVAWNTFKWDSTVNRWLLWDDLYQSPVQANYLGNGNGSVRVSTDIPIFHFQLQALAARAVFDDEGTEMTEFFNRITGEILTEEQYMALASMVKDPRGISHDAPRVDTRGITIQQVLGVLVTLGKVAAYTLTLL